MDEDLDEIFLLVDVGRHPERVDHIDGEVALACDPEVIEEACTVEIGVETPGFL